MMVMCALRRVRVASIDRHRIAEMDLIVIVIVITAVRGEHEYRRIVSDGQGMLNAVDGRLRPFHGDERAQDHQHDDQRVPYGSEARGCEH